MVHVRWQEHLAECYQCREYAIGDTDARCEDGEQLYQAMREEAQVTRPRTVDPMMEAQEQILDLLTKMDVRLRLIEETIGIVLQQPLVRRALGPERLEQIERAAWDANMEIGQRSQTP